MTTAKHTKEPKIPREDRIDLIVLEGLDSEGCPVSISLLPEEVAHIEGWEARSCGHLGCFWSDHCCPSCDIGDCDGGAS